MNFATVLVWTDEKFSVDYVTAAVRNFRKYFDTHDTYVVVNEATRDRLPPDLNGVDSLLPPGQGWWNKLVLFSELMPQDTWLLYTDLDFLLLKDPSPMLEYGSEGKILASKDAIGWMGQKLNSSFLYMESWKYSRVWKTFFRDMSQVLGRPGGDQVYVGPMIADHLTYIEDHMEKPVLSFRFDLQKGTQIGDAYAVNFHGAWNPGDCLDWDFVREHWKP